MPPPPKSSKTKTKSKRRGGKSSNPVYILPMDPFSNPYYAPFLAAYSNVNPLHPLAAGIAAADPYAYSQSRMAGLANYYPSSAALAPPFSPHFASASPALAVMPPAYGPAGRTYPAYQGYAPSAAYPAPAYAPASPVYAPGTFPYFIEEQASVRTNGVGEDERKGAGGGQEGAREPHDMTPGFVEFSSPSLASSPSSASSFSSSSSSSSLNPSDHFHGMRQQHHALHHHRRASLAAAVMLSLGVSKQHLEVMPMLQMQPQQ